jgi:hypothetical protein
MHFSELSEQDKIQAVKDQFVLIVEAIHQDISKLKHYIKFEEPKLSSPVLEAENDTDLTVKERNKLAIVSNNIANEKLLTEFKAKNASYNAIVEKISSLKKKADCQCGSCLDVNLTSGIVIGELEPLIDAARIEVQAKSF